MKKLLLFALTWLASLATAFSQKDCCDAEVLFSNAPVTIASSAGNGTFEPLSSCSCLATNEHDSHWFTFECTTSGTFEMMITPAGLAGDFDFALYGNACPCDPNTQVISCDYTGPITPPGPFVPTGISSTPTATFGVPGATEFRPTVSLVAGERYYIIADNITTNGVGFDIQFAGTAGIGPPPPAGITAPAPLTGALTACPGATVTYSVPAANYSGFNWTVTPPVATISGTGNSVGVNWTLPGSYQLCVSGEEGCETSPTTCTNVNVNPIVTQPISNVICIGDTYTTPDGVFTFYAPGVYPLDYQSWQGCDSTVMLTLTPVQFSITVLVEEICEGDCFQFGSQNLCQSGVYEQHLNNLAGCDSTVTLSLIVVPNEAVITGSGAISCNGSPVLLSGAGSLGGANMTFVWKNQAGQTVGTASTLSVTTPGTYTLTVSSTVGGQICTDMASVSISNNSAPPANVTATGGAISCSNASVTLGGSSSTAGVTYSWAGPGGFSSGQQNPNVSFTGTYTLTVTGTNGCTATATASVNGNSGLPNVTATGGILNCTATSLALAGNSTTPGVTYGWTGPGGFTSGQQNPSVSASGTYTLTVTAPNGCSAQASALVDQNNALPTVTAVGGMIDCVSPNLNLAGSSPTPGVTFSWTGPGGFTSAQQNPNVSTPGTYVLTVTSANTCTATASAVVTQDATLPNVAATGGLLDCDDPDLALQGSSSTPGVTWQWAGPGGFSSPLEDPLISASGAYVLTVTATNGCTASATATVTQDAAQPNASATGGTLTCTSSNTTLQGSSTTPGVSFSWAGPGGFSSPQQNPTASQSGIYILTVTAANGCTATASAEVMQDAGVPVVTAAGGIMDCNVSDVTLDGDSPTPGITFSWTGPGGFTSGTLDPTVNVPGDYLLVVTAPNNCTAQATAVVELDDQPPGIQLTGGVLTCDTVSVTIESDISDPAASLAWTGPGGFTSTSPTPTVSLSGTYTLTATGANGCTGSESVPVGEDTQAPNVSANGGTVDCVTTELPLDGGSTTPGSTFAWAGPGGFAANSADTSATLPGNYVLTVTSGNGCTATATAVILEDTQVPDVQANGGILSCDLPSLMLAGISNTPGVSWAWTGPGGFTSALQNPDIMQAGNYLLTVTAANGCTASDPATVAQDANVPSVSAIGGTLSCLLTSVPLTGTSNNPGVNWAWSGPGGFISNQQNPNTTVSGNYTLTVTAPNGCSASATTSVFLNDTPPNASTTGGTLTCLAGSLPLTGNSTTGSVTFAWTGPGGFISSQQNPTVTAPGNYVLTVTATNGCTATSTAIVSADSNTPNVSATGGQLTCTALTLVLNGGSTTGGVTYAWTGPGGFTSTSSDPTISTSGTYTLTVTATNGCTNVADAVVSLNDTPPNVSANGGEITCQDPDLTLDGGSTTLGVSYAWTGPGGFTSSQQDPNVTQGGTYFLTVTGNNGCTATVSAEVTLDADVPTVSAEGGMITCQSPDVTLNGSASLPSVAWAWTGPGGFTSVEQNPTISVPGTYVLTVTTPSGCSVSANAPVGEDTALPNVVIAPPAELDCVTPSLPLDGSASDAGGDFTFLWTASNGGSFVSGEQSLTPSVGTPGIYSLEIVNQTSGCSTTASVVVDISEDAPNAATLTVTSPACEGATTGSILVEDVQGGTPGYLYSINNEPFSEVFYFENLTPGTYTLSVQDATGCEFSTSATIAAPAPLQIALDVLDLEAGQLLKLGESVELKVTVPLDSSGIASIVWTPEGIAASCDKCLIISVSPLETTTYGVLVTDQNGCTAAASVKVQLDPRRPVYVPTAFSPNGDGLNEFVTVFGGESVVKVKSFLVLSRWGETIFQYFNFPPNEPAYGWDGMHRGKELDPATFTWFAEVEFVDGKVVMFGGDVALVR